MDGLLIAEQLRQLEGFLPAERRAWRFPDDRTAVLPLASGSSLWLYSRPPQPRFELKEGAPAASPPRTPFQEQLAARAVGVLESAGQPALDRVLRLDFAPGEGFVPEPRTSLLAELTGRNANLILLDENDTILGVERVVLAQRNRYRELRPGVRYVPPPPYDKLDPLRSDPEELAARLRGREVRDVPKLIDGIGPQLFGALLAAGGSPELGDRLEGELLDELVTALKRVAREPSAALAADDDHADLARLRDERILESLRSDVRAVLGRRLKLAARRVADAEQAQAAAADAELLRHEADLLLANAGSFTVADGQALLRGYDGEQIGVPIDARLDAAGNARARYERAKRREGRSQRATEQLPVLREQLAAVREAGTAVEVADRTSLERLRARWSEEGVGSTGRSAAGGRDPGRTSPGVRFVDPRGYEVFVGRSAKENDALTFKLARSRDLWLHVQGYRGSHVVVRNQGRELPFDTVLFAARLAAGFSQARHSDNVPVDYTERKHVWRPKGAPAGAVNFAHNKTVYVTPARDELAAAQA